MRFVYAIGTACVRRRTPSCYGSGRRGCHFGFGCVLFTGLARPPDDGAVAIGLDHLPDERRFGGRDAAAEHEPLEEVRTKLSLRFDRSHAIAAALDGDLPSGDGLDAGEGEG